MKIAGIVMRTAWIRNSSRTAHTTFLLPRQSNTPAEVSYYRRRVGPEEMRKQAIMQVALWDFGQNFLKRSDITSARVLLKRAAIAGNAQAALELGMTLIRPLWPNGVSEASLRMQPKPVSGTTGAIKLGSTEAARHLARLASMPVKEDDRR